MDPWSKTTDGKGINTCALFFLNKAKDTHGYLNTVVIMASSLKDPLELVNDKDGLLVKDNDGLPTKVLSMERIIGSITSLKTNGFQDGKVTRGKGADHLGRSNIGPRQIKKRQWHKFQKQAE